MNNQEQLELDAIKQELRQTQLLLKQEEGKRIAVERDSYETKRQAKIAHDQAEALKAETESSLVQAAQDMKLALAVSQGVFGLGQMCRTYMARKVASARVVHREQQNCLLMQQAIDASAKGDQLALKTAFDRMSAVIATIKADGEAARMSAAQTALVYGLEKFQEVFDKLVAENNPA